MKTYLSVLFVLVFLPFQAQSLQKTLLWKISGNGLKNPSYLYGTMHALCEVNLNENVKKAFDKTDQLYLEIDTEDPNLQATMTKEIMMKDGQKMSDFVSTEDMAILDQFLTKNIGYSGTMLNNVKPFFVSAMLLPKLLDCEMQSVEAALNKISKEQNEPVFGLETISEQMAVFDAIPYKSQMGELMKVAKDGIDDSKSEFKILMETYNSQDIEKMLQQTIESKNAMISNFQDELLVKRNVNWIARIKKIATDKPTFFGVGAAHLPGENGVIKLLRKAGFKVDAVL